MLAGCSSRQHLPDFPPVDAAQRTTALDAAAKLRGAFNGTMGCEAIYNFPSYPRERWLTDCGELQHDMGSWLSFNPHSIVRCGMPEAIICLDGEGIFAKGDRVFELMWSLEGGRARLLSIAWQDGRQWIRIPPLPDHHFDSPPVPGRSNPEKS
jgi:hypothetical protein